MPTASQLSRMSWPGVPLGNDGEARGQPPSSLRCGGHVEEVGDGGEGAEDLASVDRPAVVDLCRLDERVQEVGAPLGGVGHADRPRSEEREVALQPRRPSCSSPAAWARRRFLAAISPKSRCMFAAIAVDPSPWPSRESPTARSWLDAMPKPPNSSGTVAVRKPDAFIDSKTSSGNVPSRSCWSACSAASLACTSARLDEALARLGRRLHAEVHGISLPRHRSRSLARVMVPRGRGGLLLQPATPDVPIWRGLRRTAGDVRYVSSVHRGRAQIGSYGFYGVTPARGTIARVGRRTAPACP